MAQTLQVHPCGYVVSEGTEASGTCPGCGGDLKATYSRVFPEKGDGGEGPGGTFHGAAIADAQDQAGKAGPKGGRA